MSNQERAHTNWLGAVAVVRSVLSALDQDKSMDELQKELLFLIGQDQDGELDGEMVAGILMGLASFSAGLVKVQAGDADMTTDQFLNSMIENVIGGDN